MQKNEIVRVTIEDIGMNGEGIGRVNGYTLFIKDAVIGDEVEAKVMKAKKSYGYARLLKIIQPSNDRVPACCAFARKCGGCQIQEMLGILATALHYGIYFLLQRFINVNIAYTLGYALSFIARFPAVARAVLSAGGGKEAGLIWHS